MRIRNHIRFRFRPLMLLFGFLWIPYLLFCQQGNIVIKKISFQSLPENPPVIDIINPGEQEVGFNFKLNGRFYNSLNEFISENTHSSDSARMVLDLFNAYIGCQVHSDLFQIWKGVPLLIMNSIGAALCGKHSGTFFQITRNAGFPSRLLAEDGHVTGEVFYGGKWHLFDPDRKIYFEKNGEILSAADLIDNPALIRELGFRNYFANITTRTKSYTDFLITTENNRYSELNGVNIDTFILNLPPHARFSFPYPPDYISDFFPYNTKAKIFLPNGFHGNVVNPLVMINAEGKGAVVFAGKKYQIPDESELLQAAIFLSKEFVNFYEVYSESDSFALVYMLNPQFTKIEAENTFILRSEKELKTEIKPLEIRSKGAIMPTHIENMNKYSPFALLLYDTIEERQIMYQNFSEYDDILNQLSEQNKETDTLALKARLEKLDELTRSGLFDIQSALPSAAVIMAIACQANEKEFQDTFLFYYKQISYKKNIKKLNKPKSADN